MQSAERDFRRSDQDQILVRDGVNLGLLSARIEPLTLGDLGARQIGRLDEREAMVAQEAERVANQR